MQGSQNNYKHIDSVSNYKGKTLQVEFSDGEVCFINSDVAYDFNLCSDTDISEERWNEAVEADNFRKAKERALYLLDYRDYSYSELVKKLEKTYNEDIAFEVADKLAELGIINDRRYAQSLARKYVEIKLFGFYRAKQEMRLKGLSSQIIEEALEPYQDGMFDRISELIDKKYSGFLDDEKGRKKVVNALLRMGYSYSAVKEVLNEYEFGNDDYEED